MVEESTLEGAVSIVTGGGGDIGTGIAAELAAAGSDVVIADVDVLETEYNQQASTDVGGIERTREVVDRVENEGQRAHVVECDVTDAEQVEAMVEEVVDEFGRIDVVANNAGVITVAPVEEMAEAEWESIVDVNAKGVFLVARAAIPHLRDSHGTIVNTASIAGEIGAGGLAHYCASKHAVLGFTKSLALELAPEVTVNAVCPGIVETPMWEDVLTPSLGESYGETIERAIPMGRDQDLEDMGRAVVFLAQNRNITGESVVVDGGILQNVI
ncbi:SDR family NAD(P)-dependent oxidoreductase [Natronococcus sp. A-GB1]|uniref:SDR family NAD(P)-dependent oxidoreductase n=1 Tax=Natronococcus sp. A-GB1 TaxID=3037648 RepID=UPI00241BE7D0|nr:SDR family NAD(P)-dependent oxidoreductase [Natronococcus sp. A-GB1]MDG5759976.1 SDR family NAD(P)-dependent oxidoreductase [Natronococcus sp. A-GB1]